MQTSLAVFSCALTVQLVLLAVLRPSQAVGDEAEYLAPPAKHPGQAPWVRVPLFAGSVRMIRGLAGGTPMAPRLALSFLSAVTVGVTTWQVERLAGPLASLVAGGLLLVSLERALFSMHIWPDTLMGLLLLLAAVLLRDRPDGWPLALACVGSIALGLRIEGGAIWALGIAAPLIAPDPRPGWILAALAVSLLAPLVFIAWNRVLWGTWKLDTTVRFNLAVAARDQESDAGQISDVMRHTLTRFRQGPVTPSAIGGLRASRLAARLRLLLGAETFASQVLIGAQRAGYSHPVRVLNALPARVNLRHGFSVLFATGLLVAPLWDPIAGGLLGAAIGVYALLVTRSRYRMALLPLLCTETVTGWHKLLTEGGSPPQILLGIAFVIAFGLLLRLAPRLDEIQAVPGS